MRAREVEKVLRSHGAELLRQNGSHRIWRSQCGQCTTVVPGHGTKDLKRGTLHGIQSDMEPCYGKGWLGI